MSAAYARPQWTGKPLVYSDGRSDPEWSECPSCLGFHHANAIACNGKREPCSEQCEAHIGEVRCHRPANHIGEHQARSALMKVEWQLLTDAVGVADGVGSQTSPEYP